MIYGKFYDKQGIYEFKGRYYKPRWMANAIRNQNWVDIYNICIQGYDAQSPEPANWPKSVLVCCNFGTSDKYRIWDKIAKSYPGLYAQGQLHYYDASIPARQVPSWAVPWQQNGSLLMHEYKGGEVVWLRDEAKFDNDIYIFMKDCDPPSNEPDDPDGSQSGNVTSTGQTVLSGGLFPMNSKTTIEWEKFGDVMLPITITVEPLEPSE